MASDVFLNITNDIKSADEHIAKAKEMIRFMTNAGQDTIKLSSELRSAEMQVDKWRTALEKEGIIIPKTS